MGMQSALMYRELSLPQRLQDLPRHGARRQGQASGTPQALPRLSNTRSRSGCPGLPLLGGAGGRVSENVM